MASGDVNTLSANKFKAFYQAKIAFINVKTTLCEIKAKVSGEASFALTRAEVPAYSNTKASGEASLSLSREKAPACFNG